jgi:hypothetical protein
MRRCACLVGLACGFVIAFSNSARAQQFRKLQAPPVVAPPLNTFNNAQSPIGFPANNNGQTPIGFNVSQIGGAGLNGATTGSVLGNTGASALGGASNPFASPYGAFNTSPFSNPYAASPYTNPYLASPYTNPYLASPYANPYMASPYANPYAAYNPYLGGGFPTGGYSPLYPPMSPMGAYNYSLNYQYLSNPNINPLSNPAFSGPFPPNIFNSMAPLNAMGFGNLLQSLPFPNAMAGQPGQQNNPVFP